jgi:hypothetical protein
MYFSHTITEILHWYILRGTACLNMELVWFNWCHYILLSEPKFSLFICKTIHHLLIHTQINQHIFLITMFCRTDCRSHSTVLIVYFVTSQLLHTFTHPEMVWDSAKWLQTEVGEMNGKYKSGSHSLESCKDGSQPVVNSLFRYNVPTETCNFAFLSSVSNDSDNMLHHFLWCSTFNYIHSRI